MASRIPRVPNIPIGAIVGAVGASAGLAGIGYLGFNAVYSVKPGEKAIVFNRLGGVKDHIYSEGTHVLVPWVEWPIIFDVRTRPRAIKSQTGTRDLQMVDIGLRVLTRPDAQALPAIYRNLGLDYDDKVLPSIVNEVVKQVIAQFNATALLTQREQVSRMIKSNLEERAKEFNLVLEDVSITDLKFGREFERAVESKQVAQQDAERARFIVEKALQDKRSIIIKAQGEAKAAEMIGKAIAHNPGFVQLRRIDAAKEIAHTISASANQVFLPSDTLLLNMLQAVGAPAVDTLVNQQEAALKARGLK
jgi:prohibitin 2